MASCVLALKLQSGVATHILVRLLAYWGPSPHKIGVFGSVTSQSTEMRKIVFHSSVSFIKQSLSVSLAFVLSFCFHLFVVVEACDLLLGRVMPLHIFIKLLL